MPVTFAPEPTVTNYPQAFGTLSAKPSWHNATAAAGPLDQPVFTPSRTVTLLVGAGADIFAAWTAYFGNRSGVTGTKLAGDRVVVPGGSFLYSDNLEIPPSANNIEVVFGAPGEQTVLRSSQISGGLVDRHAIRNYGTNIKIRGVNQQTPGVVEAQQVVGRTGLNQQGNTMMLLDPGSTDTLIQDMIFRCARAAGFFAYNSLRYWLNRVVVEDSLADGYHNTNGSSYGLFTDCTSRRAGDDGWAAVYYDGDSIASQSHHMEVYRFVTDTNGHGRGWANIGCTDIVADQVIVRGSAAAGVIIDREATTRSGDHGSIDRVLLQRFRTEGCNWSEQDHGSLFLRNGITNGVVQGVVIESMEIHDNPGHRQAIRTIGDGTTNTVITAQLSNFRFTGGTNTAAGDQFGGNATSRITRTDHQTINSTPGIEDVPPTVVINTPGINANVSGTLTGSTTDTSAMRNTQAIQFYAGDGGTKVSGTNVYDVQSVEIKVGDTVIGTVLGTALDVAKRGSLAWNTTTFTNGPARISVKATDKRGLTRTLTRDVVINNATAGSTPGMPAGGTTPALTGSGEMSGEGSLSGTGSKSIAVWQNTAEGGTNGATVTTANSGGTSGDPFFTAFGLTYSSTAPAHGSMGLATTTASSSVSAAGWAKSKTHAARGYFRCAAAPTASSIIATLRSASAQIAAVFISTAGRLCVQNGATTTVFTSTNSIPYNAQIRIEMLVTIGTTTSNGSITVSYYLGDSTTPVQTFTSIGNANTGTADASHMRWGRFSGTFAAAIYFDSLAYTDGTSFIGPYTGGATGAGLMSGEGSLEGSGSGVSTPTGGGRPEISVAPILTLDGSSIADAISTTLTNWTDSALGRVFTQATSTLRPNVVSAPNNRKAVQFDSGKWMRGALAGQPTRAAVTVAMVIRIDGTNSTPRMGILSSVADDSNNDYTSPGWNFSHPAVANEATASSIAAGGGAANNNDTRVKNSSQPFGTWVTLIGQFGVDGAVGQWYVNGTAESLTSAASSVAALAQIVMYLGARRYGGTTTDTQSRFTLARMYEYPQRLTAAERSTFNSNAQDDFGITVADYVPATQAVAGSGEMSGEGTLAAAPSRITVSGPAALTGEGSLAAIGKPGLRGVAALSGEGSLVAGGRPAVRGVASLTGEGSLAGTVRAGVRGDVALSGTGTLVASGKVAFTNSQSDPRAITGLLRWGVAGDAQFTEAGVFTSLVDRMSGAVYVPLDDGEAGPSYAPAGIGGQPALVIDGTRSTALRETVPTPFPIDTGYSAWAVYVRENGGGTAGIVLSADQAGTGTRTFQLGHLSGTTPRFVTFADGGGTVRIDVAISGSVPVGTPAVMTGVATATDAEIFVNGSTNGPTALGSSTVGGNRVITVGNSTASSGTYAFVGRIAEWGIVDHAMTSGERALLHSYVQRKFGIAVVDYVSPTDGVQLSGTGSLSAAGNAAAIGASTLSGEGSLAATGRPALRGATALSGEGSLAAAGRLNARGAVVLSGEGTLAATGKPSFSVQVALTGEGTLVGQGTLSQQGSGSGAFSGAGTLVAAGTPTTSGIAALSGEGSLAAVGRPAVRGAAALSGAGTLSTGGAAGLRGTIALTGEGSLSATGRAGITGGAVLSGAGSLVALGSPNGAAAAFLSGSGQLVGSGTPFLRGAATLSGAGTLTAISRPGLTGAVILSGTGTLVSSGKALEVRTGGAALSGTGTLVASGKVDLRGAAQLSGRGQLYGNGLIPGAVEIWSGTSWLIKVAESWDGERWLPLNTDFY